MPQFGAVWEFSENDQVGNFDEGGFFSQLFYGDAAIAQDSLLAVDESDFAEAGTGVGVAVVECNVAGLPPERRNINRQLFLGPLDDRKLAALPVYVQFNTLIHKTISRNRARAQKLFEWGMAGNFKARVGRARRAGAVCRSAKLSCRI